MELQPNYIIDNKNHKIAVQIELVSKKKLIASSLKQLNTEKRFINFFRKLGEK